MSKGLITQFFDYNIDHRNRILYLCSYADEENEVSYAMAEYAIKGLISLDGASDKNIYVVVNTPGGWVSQGMAIYDAIRECRSKVVGKVYGEAYSMGSVILQACDERVMMPNASLMIHNGSGCASGSIDDIDSLVKFTRKYDKICEDIYLEKIREIKPRFTREQLKKLLRIDTYMTAEEAVNIGLADEILHPKG